MDKLFIIDATGNLFRSYYAIGNITNEKGESTNAVFGFIRTYQKLIKDFNPEYIVAVFDGPDNIFDRKKIYSDYKAHREKAPEDLNYQVQWAIEFCKLVGLPFLMIPQKEADDVIGTVAKWAEKKGANVYLCTTDKDMAQLVNEKIKILNTYKDNQILGPKEIEEKWGIPPEKVIDWLAIVGDSSDNVPGIAGLGPKTATSLLKEFGSLENILANIDKISGKSKKEKIQKSKDLAKLSKQLVTLDLNVKIPQDENFYKKKPPHIEELKKFYLKMNFISLLRELEKNKNSLSEEKNRYHLIDDEKSLKELIHKLSKEKQVCIDTETTGVRPLQASLVGIGLGIKPNEAFYIPVNGNLGLEKVISLLKPFIENEKIGFYGHNIKYDYHILKNYGLTIKTICFDTIIASYLLNSHIRQHSLDYLVLNIFGKAKTPIEDLIGKGKKQISMWDVPIEKVFPYCCEDVDYTCRLKDYFAKKLAERKLENLYFDLELPLISVLAQMERNGIYVDVHLLQKMSKEIREKLNALAQDIYKEAGEEFNINSPKQLSYILYEKLGITPPKKTATGFSTKAEVLESLKKVHPIAEKIVEYRTLEKLRSTYIDALQHEINPHTHRIHCTFSQFTTATGRLACQNPNLQNIPIRKEEGRKIRNAFKPDKKGWSFLSADYSQIELRLVAHFSEDPNMINAFKNGEDIHTHTASQIFNIPQDQVTKEQRYRAKAVNFGIIYGQQAFGLSKELGIDVKEAKAFIKCYFEKYEKVLAFVELCKKKAHETKKAITITGRERLIPEINSKNAPLRAQAERLAVNTPLQGSAADLIKMAMLKIDKALKDKKMQSLMLLQIHDEVILEAPDEELNDLKPLIRDCMENVMQLKVPLVVDISVGKNWGEC